MLVLSEGASQGSPLQPISSLLLCLYLYGEVTRREMFGKVYIVHSVHCRQLIYDIKQTKCTKLFPTYLYYNKGKGNFHPRTDHEGPEGSRVTALPLP